MTAQRHYIWVDYAKFLSIFLVVFFHTPPELSGMVGASLHLLRMPCFFFLAGLLFRFDKHPTFKQYFFHRSKQLLIPYFCFFLLFYAYWLIIGRKTGDPEDLAAPLYQPIIEYLLGVPRLVCKPLWFVPCLFAMQCVFYLLFKRMNRPLSTLILFLFPFISLFVNLENTPFSLGAVFGSIPFYGIASLYRKEIFNFLEKRNHYGIALISLFTHVIFSYYYINQTSDVLRIFIELSGSFSILFAVSVFVKLLSDYWGRKSYIENMANNAIVILAFHTYSIIIIQRVIMWYFSESIDFFEGRYVLKLIIAAITMVSMLVPIWFINKYIPFVLARKRGKLQSPKSGC